MTDLTNVITLSKVGLWDTYNNSGVGTNSTANYIVDTTAPSLSVIFPSEFNFMSNFNLTRYINFSDVGGVSSCVVSILNENPTFCNITNFNFSFNGNKTINVTLTDNVGNTNTSLNSLVYINPYFEIIFEDSSTNLTITNFNISSSLGNETFNNSFIRKLYDYGIGTHNFTFIKTGYLDRDFNLTFTNSSTINETIVINNAYINIFIYDIMTNALISPNNYTIYYLNEQTGATNIYTITNNNTYSFVNPYDSELNATLQLFNSSSYLVSNRDLVSPRENITFNLYTTNETTRSVSYEVLDASYNQIIGGEVDLYVNIPNTNNFVLQTTKITNIYGRVNFDVVAFQLVYNVCNTNDNVEKCDNLRVFDNLETEYQIVHDSTLNLTTPVNVLGNIIWSYNEDAGTNSSYMTFTFEDTSAQTDEFCINVTRYTNRTATDFYLECNTNYVGQVAQNYSLGEDQYLQYTFLYTENGSFYIPLKTINSYYENQFITYFKNLGIYNYLFLIIIFVIIGSLLEFKSKVFYSIGFLGSTLVLYSIQSYLNYDFIIINMWAIFAVNHLLFWYTNLEN